MRILNCDVAGLREWVDVEVERGRIARIVPSTQRQALRAARPSIDAAGGSLLPGLNDHHIHLLALAAARASLRCGPPQVETSEALRDALRRAPAAPGAWIRGLGYHDSVAGPLSRHELDAWVTERPVRIQHRSGALWILNSRALEILESPACGGAIDDASIERAGGRCERDESGRPTGRFFRADRWLRERFATAGGTEEAGLHRQRIADVAHDLAQCGVTGLCDATPTNGPSEERLFADALAEGAIPQRVLLMGNDALGAPRFVEPERTSGRLATGARKWMLDEAALPAFDELCASIRAQHRRGRGVAVHCVTRTDLAFALTAFREAGPLRGDRIEHAAVADDEALGRLQELGSCVVTQPNFLLERGDRYAAEVADKEQPWLYRGAGFDRAGVALAGGTDAPFGEPDPWAAMRAAVERRSPAGHHFGANEELTPERALALFTTRLRNPGGRPRRVAVGEPADLVLLDRPWREARRRLRAEDVRATCCSGRWFGTDAPLTPAFGE